MITPDEAFALLIKLQNAAPAATAVRLGEVRALLDALVKDNAYLSAQLHADAHVVAPAPLAADDETPARLMADDAPPAAPPGTSLLLSRLPAAPEANAPRPLSTAELSDLVGGEAAPEADAPRPLSTAELSDLVGGEAAPDPFDELLRDVTHVPASADDETLPKPPDSLQWARAIGIELLDTQSGTAADETSTLDKTPVTETLALGADDLLALHLDEVLRPPVLAVRDQCEMLALGTLGKLTGEQTEALRGAMNHAGTALAILDGLQQMVGLRHGLLSVDSLVFSATLLLREAYNRVVGRAQMREHRINIQYPRSTLQTMGDFNRTLAILIDLLDNAIRYTPHGGSISLSAEDLGDYVLFSIADTGIGLSVDDAQHVSEPFWRALHQPLVQQHLGTGLRLHLARELLTLQGGTLIFSGEPNVGSTFSFTLPAART